MAACGLDPTGAVSAKPLGCEACLGRGYKGRAPLFESITIDGHNRALIRAGMDEQALSRSGDGSLMEHGLALAAAGFTSFDEVLSVASEAG